MAHFKRHRLPWSMNEINRLYNEYEINELPIATIAKLHDRSEYAILYKLAQETLILDTWGDVKGWNGFNCEENKSDSAKDVVDGDGDDEDIDGDDEDIDGDDEDIDGDDEDIDGDDDGDEDDDDSSSDYEEEEEEEEEEDNDYYDEDDMAEFDPYSIPQKVSVLRKAVDAIKFFIYAV